MKAAIPVRSGSFHARSGVALGSPGGGGGPDTGAAFLRRSPSSRASPRSAALHVDAGDKSSASGHHAFRRARSEADLFGSAFTPKLPLPAKILEEEDDGGDLLGYCKAFSIGDLLMLAPVAQEEEEEVECSNGGMGGGRKVGSGGGSGGGDQGGGGGASDHRRIGDYYQEMLRSDPGNPLLLRNYGKFLHEVEGDVEAAAECYGRAILASPADGEVLSLYGRLLWETRRERDRAGGYFERAVAASPDDCYVLGSYASFMWDAEEEEDGDQGVAESTPLVEAF